MKILFMCIDAQKDFINNNGALYVKGAEEIKLNLRILTELANKYGITIINTGDYHNDLSEELSDNPDFKNTFPKHCIMGTIGSEFVDEVMPRMIDRTFYTAPNYAKITNSNSIVGAKSIIIYKDSFDVFKDSTCAKDIIEFLSPDMVIVYGVATNVCVNYAVQGLISKGRRVTVVVDAIKELPDLPIVDIIHDWKSKGVKLVATDDIEKILKQGE